jgi:hypothetical protein
LLAVVLVEEVGLVPSAYLGQRPLVEPAALEAFQGG